MDVRGDRQQVIHAIRLIAESLLHFANNPPDDSPPPAKPVEMVGLQWLVHGRHMGALMGKAGVRIQKVVADSGAGCHGDNNALFESTEKVLLVRGRCNDAVG